MHKKPVRQPLRLRGPKGFVDLELKIVAKMFDTQKVIYPQAVLVKNNERFLIPVKFTNNAHKDIVCQGIKDLVKTVDPDVVVYMAEAWMTTISDVSDFMPLLAVPKEVSRIEILHVQIEFKTGEKFGSTAEILRENGKVSLSRFDTRSGDLSMGRFVDFFPQKLQ